jgi:hypothetical protein
MSRTYRWRCCACQEEFASWTAAERHADDEGHHRVEVLVWVEPDVRS